MLGILTLKFGVSIKRNNAPIPPDHVGLFETALLAGLEPELVDLDQLETKEDSQGDREGEAPNGIQRRDVSHPLYGVMGADPRDMEQQLPKALVDKLVSWLTGLVD